MRDKMQKIKNHVVRHRGKYILGIVIPVTYVIAAYRTAGAFETYYAPRIILGDAAGRLIDNHPDLWKEFKLREKS